MGRGRARVTHLARSSRFDDWSDPPPGFRERRKLARVRRRHARPRRRLCELRGPVFAHGAQRAKRSVRLCERAGEHSRIGVAARKDNADAQARDRHVAVQDRRKRRRSTGLDD